MVEIGKAKSEPALTHEIKRLKYQRQLNCCRFSPCGRFVFAGAYDGTIQRWKLDDDAKPTAFRAHNGWLTDLEFQPNGTDLFSVDSWGKLCCWSFTAEKPKLRWQLESAHASWIRTVALSPDGKTVAAGGNDLTVRLFAAENGRKIRELAGHAHHIHSIAFHPDGKSLVSGDLRGSVKHWDWTRGKLVREFDASLLHNHPEKRTYDAGGVRAMRISADGKTLICSGISGLEGSTVKGFPAAIQFDWESAKPRHVLRPKNYENEYKVHGIFVEGLRLHRDGFLIGVGGNGERAGAMWFWKLDSPEPFFELNRIAGSRDIDLHPDGLRFAVAQFAANGRGINGGNGRKTKRGEYHSHDGVVRIYSMTQKIAGK